MSVFQNDFIYIAEQTTPPDTKITNVEEVPCKGAHSDIWFFRFKACLQSFDVLNRNSRSYILDEIRQQLQTERIRTLLQHNRFYGEQGHPVPEYDKFGELTRKRLMEPFMDNCSHAIINPTFEGNLLIATIETLASFKGPNMRNEIVRGADPAFSGRFIAFQRMENGRSVVHVRYLTTYDWVLFPSHPEAEMITQPSDIIKTNGSLALENVTESVSDNTITNCMTGYKDVFIPIRDITDLLANSDQNTEMILEGWDMDESNISGITKNGMVQFEKDGNQYLTKMTNNSRLKIMDYLSSL